MKNTKIQTNVLLALGTAFAFSTLSAHAGSLLRLKSVGTIPFPDRSDEMLRQHRHSFDAQPKHFVVQFAGHITEADRAALAAQGLVSKRYMPDDALLVEGTERAIAEAKLTSASIRSVAAYLPEWKLSPEFWTEPSLGADAEQILVSAFDGVPISGIASEIGHLPGVTVLRLSERDMLISAPSARLADLARTEGVEWVQRAPLIVDFLYSMDADLPQGPHAQAMTFTGYESGTRLMGFEAAWSRGYRGKGQFAAVADTGLDTGNLSTVAADFKPALKKGYLMGLGCENWEDTMGHGTHVSGSIVGNGALSDGSLKGGAHEANLLFESLWSGILDNLAPTSDYNKLIGTVYKDGARVHSNSWGSARNLGDYDTMASRMDEYMWNNPEMLVLFAAGNSGEDTNHDGHIDEGSIGSPATAKNVLSVGASENLLAEGGIQKQLKDLNGGKDKWGVPPLADDKLSDNDKGIAAFSSRGPTSDGRLKPEIVAPGTNIVSTRAHNPKASPLWGPFGNDYAYAGGTSMATPLTAGAATVLRQFLVEGRGIAAPTAALVKATLIHTATDLFPGQYGLGQGQELATPRPNVHEGYGRVDMDLATRLGAETQLIDDRIGLGLKEEKKIEVKVREGGSLRATLSYTDAPASTSSSRALVNDLDLEVRVANYTNSKFDRVNNTEMVELKDLGAGTYAVVVRGENVPQGRNGKQPYALVITTN
jgi:serine protease AprX